MQLLLGLVATAVYVDVFCRYSIRLTRIRIAFYRIRANGLPISIVTATATMMLPVLTGAGLQRAHRLASSSNQYLASAKPSVSWSILVAFMLLIIYDTAIATLALTHMTPPNDLICPLERRWSQLFSSKNAAIIRTIQERHQCCGFRSVQNMPWPFPDPSHTLRSCAQTFGRERGCLGGWRQDQQITAGLMLLVAVMVFVLKVSNITSPNEARLKSLLILGPSS